MTREFGLTGLVWAIIKNDPGQFLPEQRIFKEPWYRLASTERGPASFVNPSDLGAKVGDFEARFPDNFGYFVVSHVGLNLNKTEALLYVDHFCGGLCGGGEYVQMRKVDGVWHVVDQHGTWVS